MFTKVRGWWRGTKVAQPPRESCTGQSRVTLPSAVDVPTEVLQALRELHHDLDAYILPWGDVWIVQYRENKARIIEGRKAIAEARAAGFEPDRSEMLMAEGWELLSILPYHLGTSATYVTQYISPILNASEKEIDAAYKQLREDVDGTTREREREAYFRERLDGTRREWRGVIRKRVTVAQ